jgi:Domain of unknown function (DUF4391)
MIISRLVDAFCLPRGARVDHRIPKTLLLERGAPTVADRRNIRDGVDQLTWIASLKPATVGVAAFSDYSGSWRVRPRSSEPGLARTLPVL